MPDWTRRIRRPPGPEPLQELRAASQDLAQQARHAPGQTGIVFQNVANVALIATALVSGALATVHLWRALSKEGKASDHQGRRGLDHQGDDRGPFRSR